MDAVAGILTHRIQTLEISLTIEIDLDSAAKKVRRRHDRDGILAEINVQILALPPDGREALLDVHMLDQSGVL